MQNLQSYFHLMSFDKIPRFLSQLYDGSFSAVQTQAQPKVLGLACHDGHVDTYTY